MPWFLVLHIIALLFWCAALLYLPALVAGNQAGKAQLNESALQRDSIARFMFTHVATPAALLAITFGTLVFLQQDIVEVWLLVKLTLVVGLVACHALAGTLIKYMEDGAPASLRIWCWLLEAALCALMVAIIWIVLAKPPPAAFWPL